MTASIWTQDRIDRLRTLWLEGRTAEQVARTLGAGITRSAVLGKVHRLGLSTGRQPAPVKAAVLPRGGRPTARGRPVAPPPPTATAPQGIGLEEPGLATLLSVGGHGCRWPMGDPQIKGFSLCGRQAVRGAYCARHGAIAYRPAPDSRRSLDQLARLN